VILGSKREDRFSNLFLNWYKIRVKFCFVTVIYVRARTLRKFPQKCNKIARCWGEPFIYAKSDHLDTWLIPGPSETTGSRQSTSQPWSEAKCTCNTASSTLSCLFQQKERDKAEVSTSAGTFACPAETYRNCRGEAGTKNEPNWYFVPLQKNGSESRCSHFELKISLISFFKRFMSNLQCSKLPDFWWAQKMLLKKFSFLVQ